MCRNLKMKLERAAGAPRRFVAVDIENVVGAAVLTVGQAEWALAQIKLKIGIRPCDQIVIGVSHIGLFTSATGWKDVHPRLVFRSGPDGADLALLDVIESEDLSHRFDELVLISGDAIFTEAIARAEAAGLRTHVAAHHGSLSRRLQVAAGRVTFLTDHDLNLGDAA